MFIHVKSTRHTKIGTLRRGMVYSLDDKNTAAQAVVAAHSKGDNPAVKKITEKEAKKLAAKVISLEAQAEEAGPDISSDAEEMAAQFEAMTATLINAQEGHAAEVAKVAERDATIEQLKAQIAELTTSAPKTDANK